MNKPERKVTKASVRFRQATGAKHCGSCAMFHRNTKSCDLVMGIIHSDDVCDKWVKKNG